MGNVPTLMRELRARASSVESQSRSSLICSLEPHTSSLVAPICAMRVLLRLLIAVVLVSVPVLALNSIKPPSNTDHKFYRKFGCAIAADSKGATIYASSNPQYEGSDAWRAFSYTSKPGTRTWELESTFSTTHATQGGLLPETEPCVMDVQTPIVVVGEPWVTSNKGRVILRPKVEKPGERVETMVLAEGKRAGDRFGQSVALNDRWLVIGAPGGDHVTIYQYVRDAGYVEHTWLSGDAFGGADLEKLTIGASVSTSQGWVVIGAPSSIGHSLPGIVFVFAYSDAADEWSLYQTINPTANVHAPSFGANIRSGSGYIYISAPGSSTQGGTVSLYQHGSHKEYNLFGVISATGGGDEFGYATSGGFSALAVSEQGTPSSPSNRVHVYLKCGTSRVNAIHAVIAPTSGDIGTYDVRWGSSLAWSLDTLFIASSDSVETWTLPVLRENGCGGSTGIFPPASCCYEGSNVIVSDSSGGLQVPSYPASPSSSPSSPASTTIEYINRPVKIYEPVTFLPHSVLAVEWPATVSIDAHVKLNGVLRVKIPKPSQAHSQQLNNIMNWKSKEGSFSHIEAVTSPAQASCDRIHITPVYKSDSLSLNIIYTPGQDCVKKNAHTNPLIPVIVVLILLALTIAVIAIALWRFPHLREMFISRHSRHSYSQYRHTRLATEDTNEVPEEGNELSDAYADYPEDGVDGKHFDDPEIEDDNSDNE